MDIYNFLQAGSGLGTVVMLVLSMQMHGVKWWLPIFTYALFFTCFVTFLTAFFMQGYAFDLAVCCICVLAVTGLAVVYHSHVNPKDKTVSEARNKRILYIAIPSIALILAIAIYGLSSKDNNRFLQNIDRNTRKSVVNQDSMLKRMDKLEEKADRRDSIQISGDSASSAYRKKLDKDLLYLGGAVKAVQLEQQNQSLRIHKNTGAIQKMGGVVK